MSSRLSATNCPEVEATFRHRASLATALGRRARHCGQLEATLTGLQKGIPNQPFSCGRSVAAAIVPLGGLRCPSSPSSLRSACAGQSDAKLQLLAQWLLRREHRRLHKGNGRGGISPKCLGFRQWGMKFNRHG